MDFFFTLENAAKAWDEAHPEAEVLFAQGQSATDDAGQIAAIEDLVAQGVQGIAVTPTSAAVIPALDKAIAAGVPVVLMDNDLPDWTGKSSVVATDNLAGWPARGRVARWAASARRQAGDPRGRAGSARRSMRGWTACSRAWATSRARSRS